MAAYLGDHLFEAVALFVTSAAALNYAVGRSYIEGWLQAAGIPSRLFPADTYEAIFTGVKLGRVWLAAGIVLLLATAYIWVGAVAPDWWAKRRARRKLRVAAADLSRSRGWGERGLRSRLAGEAFLARNDVAGHSNGESRLALLRWQVLGPRGHQKLVAQSLPWKRPHVMTVILLLVVMISGAFAGLYKFINDQLFASARNDGVRNYAKIYLAVTGRFPHQFGSAKLSPADQKDWACEGSKFLTEFRTVTLPEEGGVKDSLQTFYVIQGTDKLYVLLGESGSVIRSFGDGPFSLKESATRPLAAIASKC